MPAQPLLAAATLRDQVVAVVDEQLQLAQRLLPGTRPVEQRLLQRRPRNRERVDPVGLTTHPAAPALRRGQPWRHPHQPLALTDQRLLEGARHMPAILDSPQPLHVGQSRPHQQAHTDRAAPGAALAAELVDGDRRQRVLVYVHPDHDHSIRLQPEEGATGERTDLNRGESHAPIRSRSTVSGRRRRHNTGKSAKRRHSGIESAAAFPSLSPTPDDTHQR